MSGGTTESNLVHETFFDGKVMGIKVLLPGGTFKELERQILDKFKLKVVGISSIILKRNGEAILLGTNDVFD